MLRMIYLGGLLCCLALLCAFASCSKETGASSAYRESVLQARREKNLAFKSDPGSPLRKEDRGRFQGLAYFDVDPGLRYEVKLNRYAAPQAIRLSTNTGEIRSGVRYGYFEFQVQGNFYRLQAYRLDDSEGDASLFVPFRDATSGKETYGAGRYIDLHENTSGIYDLDFNRAYNPYCAYGRKDFSCPFPPAENTLTVPIRAGEKLFPLAHQQ